MMGCHLFHLHLQVTVGWVHVVELFHATGSHIALLFCIKQFVQVNKLTFTTQEQAQVVKPGERE